MTESEEPAWIEAIRKHRVDKTNTFRSEVETPLSESARRSFDGLEWFPIDESARISGRFEPFDEPRATTLEATSGPPMTYDYVGQLGVSMDGQLSVLSVYRSAGVESLLVPFRDPTNGQTTWEHGRYLTIPANELSGSVSAVETVTVDFNMAYHPLCVYDDSVRSALPPTDNEIPVAVRAGERL